MLVGITTIRFGVTRYGPSAPDTFQFGKYEDFTITGTPDLADVEGDGVGAAGDVRHLGRTGDRPGLGHLAAARSAASRRAAGREWDVELGRVDVPVDGVVSARLLPAAEAPSTTAGSFFSGSTSSLSLTWKTTQGPLLATSSSSGLLRPRSIMCDEIAM